MTLLIESRTLHLVRKALKKTGILYILDVEIAVVLMVYRRSQHHLHRFIVLFGKHIHFIETMCVMLRVTFLCINK